MKRIFDMSRRPEPEMELAAPLGLARAHALQRLQIGLTGVVLMVLLVGLASVIQTRANQSEAGTVPAAAPTTEPSAVAAQSDPLAEAGVVPEMPSSPPAGTPDNSSSNGRPAGNPGVN